MNEQSSRVGVFILAKNEIANIDRCLTALARSEWDVCVLDSGSTDGTQACVAKFSNAFVIPYAYIDHCTAYNDVTTELGLRYEVVVVLDADMVVTDQLRIEVEGQLKGGSIAWNALQAPVEMWVEGRPLRFGSLYPPKVFVLRTGKPLFVSTGHAEKLVDGLRTVQTVNSLVHDDRKAYASFLQSQGRYASNLADRYERGEVSGRDRLRVRTPFLIAAVPLVSFFMKGGFLSGKCGVIYALDRLIAEAIMFRNALSRSRDDKA